MFLFNYYSYLNLTLIPSTKDIDDQNNRITTKVLICRRSLWKRPEITNDDSSSLSGPRTGQTDPPDRLLTRIPSAALLQGRQSAAGWADSRWLQSAAHRCLIADAWPLQVLIPLLHQPPPLTLPNNWAVSPPDYFFFSLCHSLQHRRGMEEMKTEKQERLFSHRVNPCH